MRLLLTITASATAIYLAKKEKKNQAKLQHRRSEEELNAAPEPTSTTRRASIDKSAPRTAEYDDPPPKYTP